MRRVRLPPPQLVRQYAQVGNRWAFLLECGHTIELQAEEIRGAPGKVAAIQCHYCGPQGGRPWLTSTPPRSPEPRPHSTLSVTRLLRLGTRLAFSEKMTRSYTRRSWLSKLPTCAQSTRYGSWRKANEHRHRPPHLLQRLLHPPGSRATGVMESAEGELVARQRPILHVAECLGPHGTRFSGDVWFLAISECAPLDANNRAYVQSRYGYYVQDFGSFGDNVEEILVPLRTPRFVTTWRCLRTGTTVLG